MTQTHWISANMILNLFPSPKQKFDNYEREYNFKLNFWGISLESKYFLKMNVRVETYIPLANLSVMYTFALTKGQANLM